MNLYYWLARTMLIERLLGVAVYAGVLLVICFVIRNAKSYTTLSRALSVYLCLLCVMAFFYIPGEQADLFRWRLLSADWMQLTFREFFDLYLTRVTTPVAYLMIYLCNKTGIEGILPAFCAWIFFRNAFYILKDLYRRHCISAQSIAITLMFLMAGGGFLEVISGVRCFVSLSILARCFYDEIYNQKPILRTIGWEIAAALIHSMALALLVGRLCFIPLQKGRRVGEKLLSAAAMVILMVAIFSYDMPYVIAALEKMVSYASNSVGYSYFWEHLLGVMMVGQFVIVLLKIRWTLIRMPGNFALKNFRLFNTALVLAEVVLAFEYNMFHRAVMFSTLTMLPVVAEAINDRQNRGLDRVVGLIALFVLFLACARGNLSGYKFMMFY